MKLMLYNRKKTFINLYQNNSKIWKVLKETTAGKFMVTQKINVLTFRLKFGHILNRLRSIDFLAEE